MKVEAFYNKKEKKQQYRCRFQFDKKEYFLTADTKKELKELTDEIRVQIRRNKRGISDGGESSSVKLSTVFDKHLPTIAKSHQRTLAKRVFGNFLKLLPAHLIITDLKKAHFQKYIDWRRCQKAQNRKTVVLDETIDKELYAISSALKNASLYFIDLEDYRKPEIPKAKPKGKKRRRERLVGKESELDVLLNELRKDKIGKQTEYTITHRRRLADDLEFRYETGLRRIESARLKFSQYHPTEEALRKIIRWKTGTVTNYYPLSRRAVELIEHRRTIAGDSEYIFTTDGEAVQSDYRTLKLVCKDLDIPYGRYTDGGFVPHDLRHNFATEIVQVTDIETAKSLTGHTGNDIFTYLHTTEKQQREAVRRREKRDLTAELTQIYEAVEQGEMSLETFVENIKKLALN